MDSLRPAGAGKEGSAEPFMRLQATPRAALILVTRAPAPRDWPEPDPSVAANLGHALGYTCEVRRNDIVLLNPLGEGIVKTTLPELSDEWLTNVHHDGSCALYLVHPDADGGQPDFTIEIAARTGVLAAATVRTAVADDAGAGEKVGRNDPCPCGSGKKFKQCHGAA